MIFDENNTESSWAFRATLAELPTLGLRFSIRNGNKFSSGYVVGDRVPRILGPRFWLVRT